MARLGNSKPTTQLGKWPFFVAAARQVMIGTHIPAFPGRVYEGGQTALLERVRNSVPAKRANQLACRPKRWQLQRCRFRVARLGLCVVHLCLTKSGVEIKLVAEATVFALRIFGVIGCTCIL